MARAAANPTMSYRLSVTARAAAATVGGFVLTSAFCLAVALLLIQQGWMVRASAVSLMTMISWMLWTAFALWAFHATDARKVWAWLVCGSVFSGGLAWFLINTGVAA